MPFYRMTEFTLADFDYELPNELIARYPLPKRSDSRLLVLNRAERMITHHYFKEIGSFLQPDDLLVFNNSKVMPARLFGQKMSGGRLELLIERVLSPQVALCHIKASHAPKIGQQLLIAGVKLEVCGRQDALFELKLISSTENFYQLMLRVGEIPLPPYMERQPQAADHERYQTVYAEPEGSVAAPTAGLHFDQALLAELSRQGVQQAKITLHVGAGTFQPVRVTHLQDHVMHKEWLDVPASVCKQVQQTKLAGKRVIAVGTTSVRSLETAAQGGAFKPYTGDSQLFIRPGYEYRVVDAMITNFHLPKSTLLMLVSAFAGYDFVREAYQIAIAQRYRFFSYGDAMLIL